jgi:hypothetical protein
VTRPTRRAVLTGALAAAACPWPGPTAPLAAEVYAWRRSWDASTTAEVLSACATWDRVLVLALEVGADGSSTRPDVPWSRLSPSSTPVVRLARVDQLAADILLPRLDQLGLLDLPARLVQLDVDAPTRQLPLLARHLAALAAARPDLGWEITALPTWLTSPALPDVLAPLRRWTLQVHATSLPTRPEQAALMAPPEQVRAWLAAALLHRVPVSLALPAYAYRMAFDPSGAFLGLEAEQPRSWPGSAQIVEAWPPHAWLPDLVRELQGHPPAGLRALSWFRLPHAGDRLSWSLPALERARRGMALSGSIEAVLRPTGSGSSDVVLRAVGDVPASLDGEVVISPAGTRSEGVGGFVAGERGLVADRARGEVLRPGEERVVGWTAATEVRWLGSPR